MFGFLKKKFGKSDEAAKPAESAAEDQHVPEQADAAGIDLSKIHSVASFFISRVDSEIDKRLEALGADAALQGKAAIANAEVALGAFNQVFSSDRFKALAAKGANPQRPLWASTGTKNAAYPDTLYVSDLVAQGVVNTMPEKTLLAYGDHGELGAPIEGKAVAAQAVLDQVSAAGVDLAEVFDLLETEGVEKFIVSWHELQDSVKAALEAANS